MELNNPWRAALGVFLLAASASTVGAANLIGLADPDVQTAESSVDAGMPTATSARTIDGSGLGGGFPLFPTTHTNLNVDGWLSGLDDQDGWVQYDFGKRQYLSEVRFWNYNDAGGCCNDRGVKDLDIYATTDAAAYGDPNHSSWQRISMIRDLRRGPGPVSYGSQWNVPEAIAQYVMLDVRQNHGANQTAFGEVQFVTDLIGAPTLAAPILERLEMVTGGAAVSSGNQAGNSWGGHQTRIVRTEDGVFTAYTADVGLGEFAAQWRLVRREPDGTWQQMASGDAAREPVNLLASPDGTLHIVANPDGHRVLWSGKPSGSTLTMTSQPVPGQGNTADFWPYLSAGVDDQGTIVVLSSDTTASGNVPGILRTSRYDSLTGTWTSSSQRTDHRYAYTYVFPEGEGVSLVNTRDVLWSELGYTKPPGKFDYVFNAMRVWETDDVGEEALGEIAFLDAPPSFAGEFVFLNAQQDAYVDTDGLMHILYWHQGPETDGFRQRWHAVVEPTGETLHVPLPDTTGTGSSMTRIFQDGSERFWLLDQFGTLTDAGMDGLTIGTTYQIDLSPYNVVYSGFGLAVPRTGTPLSNTLDLVYPSGDGSDWVYARISLPQSSSADVDEDEDIDGADFLVWQRSYLTDAVGDANGDGVTNDEDLEIWQNQFGQFSVSSARSTAIPEPSTWGLFLGSVLMMLVFLVPRGS